MPQLINDWRATHLARSKHPGVRPGREAYASSSAMTNRIRTNRTPSHAPGPANPRHPVAFGAAGTSSSAASATPRGGVESQPRASPTAADVADSPASGPDLNRALLVALAEQFQKESLPWIQDLVVPLFEGAPQPLTGTVPPEQLADRDSRFTSVQGVRIHYKMALPGEREGGVPPRTVTPQPDTARPPAATSRWSASQSATPPSPVSPSGLSKSTSAGSSGSSGSSVFRLPRRSPRQEQPGRQQLVSEPAWSVDGPRLCPDPDAAPALLLMHGLNGSTFNWRLLMDDLAAYVSPSTGGCRVIAYDRPPYGLSQRPVSWRREEDNPYTVEGGARLAAGLLDELLGPLPSSSAGKGSNSNSSGSRESRSSSFGNSGLGSSSSSGGGGGRGRAVLVGHSAGAAVAVETALRYPDRVCGLVLIAPAISTDSRGFLARADLGQLLRFAWTRALLSADGPGLNYVRRQVLKRKAQVEEGRLGIYVDEREVPQEVIDGYLRPLRANDWDKGTLLVYRSLQVSGAPPPLEQIRVPVLVLQGREDTTVPLQTAQAVAEALRRRRDPGAVTELRVLERCGHVPMDEQPLEVLQAIVEFVNRNCCGDPQQQQQQQQQQEMQLQPPTVNDGSAAAVRSATSVVSISQRQTPTGWQSS